jgi:hypothetical protein
MAAYKKDHSANAIRDEPIAEDIGMFCILFKNSLIMCHIKFLFDDDFINGSACLPTSNNGNILNWIQMNSFGGG